MGSSSNPEHSRVSRFALAIAVVLACASQARESYAQWPQPDSGYVTDRAGVLSPSEEERIEQWLIRVEEESQVEIIVVTIHSISDFYGTGSDSIETFATGLFNRWGIGNQPRNDGILLLVAVDDRRVRIELGAGYVSLRDRDAQKIIQSVILPRFRKNDYAGGITEGVRAIIEEFTTMRVGTRWNLILIPIAIVACLVIGISLVRNGKKGWGWAFVGLALVLLLVFLYLLVAALRLQSRYGLSSGWSAGGSGGFGGGSSGGGGATGSW